MRFIVERGLGFKGFVAFVIGGLVLWKLPQSLKVIKILFYHLPVDGSLKAIGKALAEALSKTHVFENVRIQTSARSLWAYLPVQACLHEH